MSKTNYKDENLNGMLALKLTAHNSGFLCNTNTGLGNVLFELSSQYAICKKYNIKSNYYLLHQFIQKLKTINLNDYENTIYRNFKTGDKDFQHKLVLRETKSAHIYDDKLISTIVNNKDKNILIRSSYLQSIKYFNEYKEDIQNLFSPDEASLFLIF